ncbi:MAG: hypothetical protein U0325_10895 [Polyangiales bacterium]
MRRRSRKPCPRPWRGHLPRLVVLLAGAAGCAAPPAARDAEVDVDAAAVVLVATAPEAHGVCAPELTATACGRPDALLEACQARLRARGVACDGGACVTPYTPLRGGPCAAGPTYPGAASCAAVVEDDCAYYRACLDARHPCGDEGYALAYGERLCHAFIAGRAAFSLAGQAWLRAVRTCLQRALVPLRARDDLGCEALEAAAYASHAGCYTAPGHSICALGPADLAALTRALAPYLRDPRAQRQIGEVLRTCAASGDAGAP